MHVPSTTTSQPQSLQQDVTATPGRRLIKPDLSLRLSASFDDDEDSTVSASRRKSASSLQDPFSTADDDEDDDVLQVTLNEEERVKSAPNGTRETNGQAGSSCTRPNSLQRAVNRRFSFKTRKHPLIDRSRRMIDFDMFSC